MQFFRKIFDFYINASLHVALAVFALTEISYLNLNIPNNINLGFVTFFGTIVIYNFIKYGSNAKKYFLVENQHQKIIQLLSILAGLCLLFFISKLRIETLYILGTLCAISILYIIPFHTSVKNFRSLNGVKIYIVALVWSGTTVLLPVINAKIPFTNDIIFEIIQRFLFVFVLTLPFEIRDLNVDKLHLNTIPQLIGVNKTKVLGIILIMIFFGLSFFKSTYNIKETLVLLIITVIVIIALLFTEKKQATFYSSFLVESIPLIWWGIKILF